MIWAPKPIKVESVFRAYAVIIGRGWLDAPPMGSDVVWRETRRMALWRGYTGTFVRQHVHGARGVVLQRFPALGNARARHRCLSWFAVGIWCFGWPYFVN